MATIISKIESQIIKSFTSEIGNAPSSIKINGEIVYADRYWCRIVNGKIKKTHKLAWRLDSYN